MHYMSVSIPIFESETATTEELVERYSRVIGQVLRKHNLGKVDGWTVVQDVDPPGRDVELSIDWRMKELGSALELIQDAIVTAGAPKGTRICEIFDPVNDRENFLQFGGEERFRIA